MERRLDALNRSASWLESQCLRDSRWSNRPRINSKGCVSSRARRVIVNVRHWANVKLSGAPLAAPPLERDVRPSRLAGPRAEADHRTRRQTGRTPLAPPRHQNAHRSRVDPNHCEGTKTKPCKPPPEPATGKAAGQYQRHFWRRYPGTETRENRGKD